MAAILCQAVINGTSLSCWNHLRWIWFNAVNYLTTLWLQKIRAGGRSFTIFLNPVVTWHSFQKQSSSWPACSSLTYREDSNRRVTRVHETVNQFIWCRSRRSHSHWGNVLFWQVRGVLNGKSLHCCVSSKICLPYCPRCNTGNVGEKRGGRAGILLWFNFPQEWQMTRFREFGGQLSHQSDEPDEKWL